jgi:hypothetical protein
LQACSAVFDANSKRVGIDRPVTPMSRNEIKQTT